MTREDVSRRLEEMAFREAKIGSSYRETNWCTSARSFENAWALAMGALALRSCTEDLDYAIETCRRMENAAACGERKEGIAEVMHELMARKAGEVRK